MANLYKGGKLVRRGRPAGSGTKELVSLRLDKKALAAFRSTGKGWQVRINDTVVRSAKRLGVNRPHTRVKAAPSNQFFTTKHSVTRFSPQFTRN